MSPSSDPHFMSRSVPQVSFRLTSSPRQPEILTRRGSFVLMRSVIQCVALRFVTLHLSSEQSRLGCRVSEHTRPFICSLVVLFSGRAEQNTRRHVARPCSHFHPLEFHFIVPGAFYQTCLFPLTGLYRRHIHYCVWSCASSLCPAVHICKPNHWK